MPTTSNSQDWSTDPDVQLMMQVREGDAFAFEELMRRNQSRVNSILFNMVGNREQAEDLTQDVFLRVYKARDNYQPEARFSTWLYRIVHNIALNALRSKHHRPELLFSGASPQKGSPDQSDVFSFEDTLMEKSGLMPTRLLAKKELQGIVRKAIDSLGERQRLAILLHRFEGMNYPEIAEVMDLTPKAVKSLLCRARVNLQTVLRPYIEEGRGPL